MSCPSHPVVPSARLGLSHQGRGKGAPMTTAPFVSTEWLNERLADPNVVVIDGSWYLPPMNRDPEAEYRAGHIPGAVRFDIDTVKDRSSPLLHMLQRPKRLPPRSAPWASVT